MAFSYVAAVLLVCLVAAPFAAEARMLTQHVQPTHDRRMLAAPAKTVAHIVSVEAAPLPADAFVTASPCPTAAAPAPGGSRAAATFTVGASLAPEQFKEVALQVDFAQALWAGHSLTCKDSAAKVIKCESPAHELHITPESNIASVACMLGDLAVTGDVTCTFSYVVPSSMPAGAEADRIVGSITYAPLADNVVEDYMNNADVACLVAASA